MKIGEEPAIWRQLADVSNVRVPTTFAEIKAFLALPLLCTLPLRTIMHSPAWFERDINKAALLAGVTDILHRVVRDPFVQKGGQDGIHSVVNDLVLEPLNALNTYTHIGLDFGRNTSDDITTGVRLRPDVLVWLGDLLILRGEEENNDYKTAVLDLSSKLVWNEAALGTVPFLFGFAATRDEIGLYAQTRFDCFF